MTNLFISTIVLLASFAVQTADAFVPGLYCGYESCYDVLGITRDTPKSELAKAYRKLAKQYHPDRVKGEEAKQKAEEKFRLIATAYETLKDDESRNDYDYMLDNPEERYYHYYQYYRRRVAPKVDVRIVVAVTLAVISIVQYISAMHKYNEAIDYLMTQPKYKIQAQLIAEERGLLNSKNAKVKGKKKKDKEAEREEQMATLRSIIQENIDIKGGYKRPSVVDTLVCQLVLLPYTLAVYIKWWCKWVWQYTIKREEYDTDAKLHIIRKNMKLSQSQFDCLPEGEHDTFLAKELWIKSNFDEWKKRKEEEEKQKLAESGRYKQYRRYMKNQGPGTISFLDEDY